MSTNVSNIWVPVIQEFDMANTKMGMTEEMMNDTLDDILAER